MGLYQFYGICHLEKELNLYFLWHCEHNFDALSWVTLHWCGVWQVVHSLPKALI